MKVDIGFWDINGNYIEDIQEVDEMEMDKYFEELNDMANFKNFGKKEETEYKEIIIDGVDVAGCEFLRNCIIPDNYGCKIDDSLCCDVGNCYYKQLKRLEFELKVTKADYEASEQENAELKEKNTELEETLQTIEQLKDEDSLRIAQLVTENARLKNERTADLVKQIDELKAENERLKEEIKEVKKYQYEQEFLEKEIEEQREKNKRLTCKILEVKALNETLNVQCTSQDCTQLRKLHQTLQEIKAIATGVRSYLEVPAPRDVRYEMDRILDLITKAEEE